MWNQSGARKRLISRLHQGGSLARLVLFAEASRRGLLRS